MLKKISWIVALFAAFTIVFIGCTNLGTLDDGTAPKVYEDLEFEGADIDFLKVCGNDAGTTITGNQVTFDGSGMTGDGFYFDFPEEAASYAQVQVFFKVISITAGRPGLLIKRNTRFQNAIGITSDQDPAYQLNDEDFNFVVGTEFDTGLWNTNRFDNQIAFQHQAYNPSGNSTVNYTIEVTRILFPGSGETPEVLVPPGYTGKTPVYVSVNEEVWDMDPTIVGEFGMTISATGVVSMGEGSLIKYKFPTKARVGTADDAATIDIDIEEEYDFIEIFYTVSDVVLGDKTQLPSPGTGPSDGNFKVRFRDYNNGNAYTYNGPNSNEWPNFGKAGIHDDSTKGATEASSSGVANEWGSYSTQTLGAKGTGGFTINYNYGDRNNDGAVSLKVKIDGVKFSKGTRYNVYFTGSDPIFYKDVTVLGGNSVGGAMPTKADVGARAKWGTGANDVWTFLGWTTDSNATELTGAIPAADKVGSGTVINGDKILYAAWYKGALPNVTFTTEQTIFDNIYVNGGTVKKTDGSFKIDVTGGIWGMQLDYLSPNFSVYDTLTVTFQVSDIVGSGAGFNWKTFDPYANTPPNPWDSQASRPPLNDGGNNYPTAVAGEKVVIMSMASLDKGGFGSQANNASATAGYTFKITKVELKMD